jgi:hypothetical protein
VLAELEDKATQIQKRSDYYDLKFHQATKSLQALKSGIDSIGIRMGLKLAPLAGVSTELTMVSWVAEVESAVNKLVIKYLANEEDNINDSNQRSGGRPTSAPGSNQHSQSQPGSPNKAINNLPMVKTTPTVKVPSTLDPDSDSEVDEEEGDRRPWAISEIRARVVKKLIKRQQSRLGASSGIRTSIKSR